MGQFDMLVEETKKLAREAAKATNPQLKQQFRKQDQPQVPAPRPELDSRAEYDALVARRAREAPVPPPAVPAMDKFRAVEQAQAPPRDWVPPDFTAMDPTVLAQEFKSEGSKFLQRNPDFGSDTGLEDYEISAMSAMFSARKIGASILKYQGETDPEGARAQSDARDGLFQDYEAALKLGQIDQAQYQSLLQNLPLGNLDAAAQSTLADIKAEHPLDYKYWLAAPENTSELYQKYIEHLTIPPEMPASSVQRALGLVGKVAGAVEKYGKEIPFAEPILGKGLGSLLTLGNIQKAGIAGTEAMPAPDSMKRIMEAAINTGTDPIFLLSMLAMPPYGFAAKAAIGAEIVAGSAVGGEVAPALGAPKWTGELVGAVGLTVGAGAVMKLAAAYGSPSALLGEVAAPKPFATSITGFTDNLGKRRWAGVSASTEGMTPARMLEANEELAARLRGMGYDAQVADGAWIDAGVPTFEKSVFVADMSATDAAALGAELKQKSVMIPEGVLDVKTNELNPVTGAPMVGGDLPIANGYAELTIAGKRVRFGLPIDWDNSVPFAIPLEAPAAAAGAETVYHGTRTTDMASFVDKDGNLHLKASSNFGGKQVGVSFSPEIDTAWDYASRTGTPGRARAQGTVFEINRAALPLGRLRMEAANELFARGADEVVIPRGQWRAIEDVAARRGLAAWEKQQVLRTEAMSDRELVKSYNRSVERSEQAEWDLVEEAAQVHAAPGVSQDIVAKYGADPESFPYRAEIQRRISESGNPTAKAEELAKYVKGARFNTDKDILGMSSVGGTSAAAAGPAATYYHGTAAGEQIRASGALQPGEGGVIYVTRSPQTAETIAKTTAKLGGGTPETVEVSAPSNMKIASEAEVDAIRRAGEKVGVNMRGDTPALANAVRGHGYDAYDAGMGRIAVVNPDLVTVGEGRSITFQPDTAADLQEGVTWKWWTRRVYERVYQFTGKIPLLRRAITPMNPQALLNEPMTGEVAALNGWLDWAAACDKMNLARLYAAPKSGWMAHVMAGAGKEDGFVVELTDAGRASKAWWKEGGQALATWNDILTYGATYYKLSAVDAKFVALAQQTLREMGVDLSKYGVEIRELLYEDGQGWIPRGAQAGKNGIEALKREYSSGRMVGGKGSFMKSRIYETQAEFHANGGDINKNAYDVIATTLTGMRRMEFDAQITEVAQRYGAKIADIVDPALKEAIPIARAYRTWDARIADYITKQMKDLTVKQSFRQLRPVAGQVPDTWYSETATKVEDIVARFKTEAKDALTARRVNPRVRVPGLSKTELNRIAKPYKAELKGLLDAAKLRQGNSMATYMRAKADYEADIMKIRSSLIAGPTERVKPEYFGRFPEDSFAIGTIGSSRWPKLTGELFPQDIITRLDKVMNDSGNTVSAAIQKLNDFPRTIQAGADMNYPFIQSLPYLFRDPVGWARAISKSYGTVFDDPALGMKYMLAQSEKYPEEFASYLKWVRQMGDQEYFQSARQGGFLYKVPGVGHWYGKLAQGFDTMLDVGRWEYWKGIYAKAKTDGDFESLGAVTRDLLGTTSTRGLGVSMTQRQIEGGILMFAPRYTRSAFGLLAWAFNPGVAGGEARRSIISLMTGGTMLYYATCKALGQSPNLNPMEPGFMSVRVGDNWLGMGGIFRSMLRSAVWSMDTAINDPSKFYDPRRVLDNPVFEFFRSRSSPITTKLIDVVSGRDFVGNPTRSDWQDVATLGRRMFLPFGVDTILQSKGAMLPRMGAVVGEFFLGRSTPVAVGQIRDEEVVKWARENDITVHDAGTGKEREPDNYRELTADQRILFDTEKPQYTKDVQENTKAMERAWTEMDAVAKATETQLATASSIYNDPNSPHYQDGTWYRSMRGSILQTARIQREAFFDANPTVERNPTTMEQKWVTDYNENVIKVSMDETLGEVDWLLQEQLDRQWRRDNGAEASAVVDKDYAASSDRLDSQFRADRIVVQPFFDFEDSMWSQDFFSDPADPIKLPSLSNGQKALNFRTSGEYRSALRADIYRSLQEAGKIPDNLAGIRTAKGGDALGERFPGKLSDTQIRRASNVLVTFFMQPFYDKSDPIVTEYLKAHPKYMEPLLRWDYWTGSVATEEALP